MEDDTESFCSSRASEAAVSRKRREKVEVYHEIVQRLRESRNEESIRPGFEDELWAHFDRLPVRYAMDVNVERPEDVLVHKRLLHSAYDSATRPAFDLRLVHVLPGSDVSNGDSVHSSFRRNLDAQSSNSLDIDSIHPPFAFDLSPNLEHALEVNKSNIQFGDDGNPHFFRHLYEITISTIDKPKLLSQLTSLLSEIGLNIKEAHAFSTVDGYSLDVFVVDAWTYPEKDQLRNALMMEIPKIEMLSRSRRTVRELDTDHLNIPTDGSDVWEIDPELLKFEHKIAAGAYGDLYKGIFQGRDVAIKVLKAEHLNERIRMEFAQEVYIMRRVRHKNVVQFVGACMRPPSLCIVTEFMSRGSVYDFMHKQKGHFKLPALLKVALDVSKGMNYLHQNNIIHRDLKAANLLMDENEVVKVADFGVARVEIPAGVMTAETGTYRWMAPEVIEHKPYDRKADIFSFGIVLWELLTGKLPYEHLTPLQAAVGVVQKGLRPDIPKHTHPNLVELLERCWQQVPTSRPDFSVIIEILQIMSDKVGEDERAVKRRNQGSENFELADRWPIKKEESKDVG